MSFSASKSKHNFTQEKYPIFEPLPTKYLCLKNTVFKEQRLHIFVQYCFTTLLYYQLQDLLATLYLPVNKWIFKTILKWNWEYPFYILLSHTCWNAHETTKVTLFSTTIESTYHPTITNRVHVLVRRKSAHPKFQSYPIFEPSPLQFRFFSVRCASSGKMLLDKWPSNSVIMYIQVYQTGFFHWHVKS